MRTIGGQLAVMLGLYHHFYFLALENIVMKQCFSNIGTYVGSQGAGMPALYHFIPRQFRSYILVRTYI